METRLVWIGRDGTGAGSEEALRCAGGILKGGGLVAFPTETVYGLGGDALNPDSARKIYAAKGRPSDNPLIVHVCRFEDIQRIVRAVPEPAVRIAQAFWPGPLTMILPKSELVPRETTGGLDTVAVRFPSHPAARKLIEYSGGYVAAPSANASGRPSPTLAKYVWEDMAGKIEMILDGGEVGIGLESTILDLTAEPPKILRPGFVTQELLDRVLGGVEIDPGSMDSGGQPPRAPGMKYRHYAPKGRLTLVEGEPGQVAAYINAQTEADGRAGERTGVIATTEILEFCHADVVKCIGSRKNQEEIARNLFAVLREMDGEGADSIYSESFSEEGLGQAIMNRLRKAAGYRVVRLPAGRQGCSLDGEATIGCRTCLAQTERPVRRAGGDRT